MHLPDEPAGYAAAIYGVLHDLDNHGLTAIAIESVPGTTPWDAVADRLRRAAASG